MLLSRFWYVVLALALGGAIFTLFLATGMYDRESVARMGGSLAADSRVVSSYLRDDARRRTTALIPLALDEEIRASLSRANAAGDKVPADVKDKTRTALRKLEKGIGAEQKFDAIFAVDQHGRVIAHFGFDEATGIEGFELGGYPVVADALHGWIRDDAWVLGGRIYRIVARPVEADVGNPPSGAIVGARIVDDSFAQELSKRTDAAILFFAQGNPISHGAPKDFDASKLGLIESDLKNVEADPIYHEKGTSDVHTIQDDLGVVYARLSGEAWDLGGGYAVARAAHLVQTPLGLLHNADDKDKKTVPFGTIVALALLAALIGLGLSYVEHSRPLGLFKGEAARFAHGQMDQLTPSRFRGAYRQIAHDVNEGIEKVAAKGGAPRRTADLESVLGPIPVQPAMSAFSLPDEGTPPPAPVVGPSGPGAARPPLPGVPGAPRPAPPAPRLAGEPPAFVPGGAANGPRPPPPRAGGAPGRPPVGPGRGSASDEDEATVVSQVPHELVAAMGRPEEPLTEEQIEWRGVFDDFVRTKQQCGEATEALTFEKFQNTLRKNRDQLVSRHNCKRVKFTVYVKEGRASLKASPVKD